MSQNTTTRRTLRDLLIERGAIIPAASVTRRDPGDGLPFLPLDGTGRRVATRRATGATVADLFRANRWIADLAANRDADREAA